MNLARLGILLAALCGCRRAGPPPLAVDILVPDHILVPAQVAGEQGYLILDNGCPRVLVPTRLCGGKAGRDLALPARLGGRDLTLLCDANPQLDAILEGVGRSHPDIRILGLLGASFLSRSTVRLDFPLRTLTLLPPGQAPPPAAGGLDDDHVLLDATFSPGGHLFVDRCAIGSLEGRLHLDLGSPGFNWDRELARKAGVQGSRIPEVRAGALRFREVPWSPRNFREVFPAFDLIGEIGTAQLQDCVVTLHYASAKLEIRREASAPRTRKLGIRLAQGLVSEVVPGSLAERMGLKPGDRILSVLGRPVPAPSLLAEAMRAPLQGKEAAIDVERAGRTLTLTSPAEVWRDAP